MGLRECYHDKTCIYGLSLPIPVIGFLNLCDFLINLWEKERREGEREGENACVYMGEHAYRAQESTSGVTPHVPPTLFLETVFLTSLRLTE